MVDQRNTHNRKSILVAEDDQFYARIYQLKFSKEGYDVTVVDKGDEVIKIARVKKPDLILLDLIMPGKDGFETLRELKTDTKLKDVKVVVISNLGQAEDIKKTKELGALDYLVKANMSISDMVEKVKGYLA